MAVLEPQIARNAADRAWGIYYRLRPQIETPDTVGKLVLIDVDSGDYEIADDELGFTASARVRERHPNANLFALRVGYMTTSSFCGSMERLPE